MNDIIRLQVKRHRIILLHWTEVPYGSLPQGHVCPYALDVVREEAHR